MAAFKLTLVFSNVFVEVYLWIVGNGNKCGIGMVRVWWRRVVKSMQIRKTMC
jgi:hypothetical protein